MRRGRCPAGHCRGWRKRRIKAFPVTGAEGWLCFQATQTFSRRIGRSRCEQRHRFATVHLLRRSVIRHTLEQTPSFTPRSWLLVTPVSAANESRVIRERNRIFMFRLRKCWPEQGKDYVIPRRCLPGSPPHALRAVNTLCNLRPWGNGEEMERETL